MKNKILTLVLTISICISSLTKTNVNALDPENFSIPTENEFVDNQNYQTFETEHFKIIYPESLLSKTEEACAELERNYEKILSDLKTSLGQKTTVKLFANKTTFHKSIGCYGKTELEWVTGTSCNGVIKSTLELEINHLKKVLVHEFTHVITEKLNPDYVPFIFKEGIATFEAGQRDLKDKLNLLKELPPACDWLFKGQFSPDLSYPIAYSFTEFIVENYGYEKIIAILKSDFRHNKFDLNSIKNIYESWSESILT